MRHSHIPLRGRDPSTAEKIERKLKNDIIYLFIISKLINEIYYHKNKVR